MLPNPQSISSVSSPPEQKRIRQFIIKENLLLSEIISNNNRTIIELQSILSKYQRDYKPTSDSELSNPLIPSPLEQTSFPYKAKLKPVQQIPNVICKSKYFRITVQLKTDPGIDILRSDRIELSVSLYTSERLPQKILFTMQGKSIFRGDTIAIMAYDLVESRHLAHFKLQISEVSSHFVGGWVYLIVEAKQSLTSRGIYIKPLVIKNLRIRAKDIKNQE
ncbi:hypothetical protein SteCoe_34347 [Stentor coeruleus]|uniref:Uncharacterized protein n=1 Tax=Stentor coeruleus TaxID=5963 RepID=A0A1R2AUQ6_9CILI|nr:hypothetical protein SteCoe_34347 [Stentor coeruleus]